MKRELSPYGRKMAVPESLEKLLENLTKEFGVPIAGLIDLLTNIELFKSEATYYALPEAELNGEKPS